MPSAQSVTHEPSTNFPRFQGLWPLPSTGVRGDIIAGLVLAALGIPEVMGYTKISGTPVVTGLYTLLMPVVAFAIFSSSRHLVVAADSATAAILAAGLSQLSLFSSEQYVGMAGLVALVTAALLLIARIFRLGFLADFLSRTVLIGFLTGVGVQVALAQLPGLFGIPSSGHGPIGQITSTLSGLSQVHSLTVGISLAVLTTIVVFEKILPKFPGALVAVIAAVIASWAFDFASQGVAVVGPVPSGLPIFGLPATRSLTQDISSVLAISLSCCVVIIAQSAATSRAYAFRYNEPFHENIDLMGLAIANIAAGLSGTFVVNGSPTKTAIVDTAGGRSQWAQLTTAVIVLIVILFLTQPISYLPDAALAAIVFLIGLKLIDIKGLMNIFATHRPEFFLAVGTAATVVFVGVKEGILFAIALSLLLHVRHSYRPRSAVIALGDNNFWQPIPVRPGLVTEPGLIVYRFSRDLFYANVTHFSEEIQMLLKQAEEPVTCFILEARAIAEIDYSAYKTLQDLIKVLSQHPVTFMVSGLDPAVKAQFDRDGLTTLIGPHRFYNRLEEALAAYHRPVS